MGSVPWKNSYYLPEDPFQLTNLAADPDYFEALEYMRSRLVNEQIETQDPRYLGTYEEMFYPGDK